MKNINEISARQQELQHLRISSDKLLPLELTQNELHICLWDEEGKYKWTIGYFDFDKEGPWFKFVGDRPMDKRVDWKVFQRLLKLGYAVAWHKFECSED
jgi:hypothetical protein